MVFEGSARMPPAEGGLWGWRLRVNIFDFATAALRFANYCYRDFAVLSG